MRGKTGGRWRGSGRVHYSPVAWIGRFSGVTEVAPHACLGWWARAALEALAEGHAEPRDFIISAIDAWRVASVCSMCILVKEKLDLKLF